ncbi:putative growth arrest and DNA damage-inducible proteins-interacting protein 1-like [Apostichopus japonicus]|uniref:Large ribosomal subunit protein mL64 n=1 Tax=Stichopus japonicus TaxID=307972 RepID=A0A2G8K6G9_STIJA|nr:putative growth arrest and DNA damage-inducible proteins-interacting protein 1-like [Apostichopus japonicus]
MMNHMNISKTQHVYSIKLLLFGSIRKKTDELKEGYAPRDQHLEGKSPEEVIKDLLAQDAGRPRKKTRSDYCKEFALHGKASGVDPSIMWPTKGELRQLVEDENYYCRSLESMQADLLLERKRKELEELKKQKHIEKCLAQLPKLEEEHRKKEEARLLKEEESRKKKAVLLEAAREKLGYAIDPRSQRFKEMVEEWRRKRKTEKKALKRKGIGT